MAVDEFVELNSISIYIGFVGDYKCGLEYNRQIIPLNTKFFFRDSYTFFIYV